LICSRASRKRDHGHLIPAGTGLPKYKNLRITLPFGVELPPIEEPKIATEAS